MQYLTRYSLAGSLLLLALAAGCRSDSPVAATDNVGSVTLSPTTLTLDVGAKDSLTAAAVDNGGGALSTQIDWSAGEPAIATVSGNGKSAVVTAVAPGTTIIRARAGTKEGIATVVVRGTIVRPALGLVGKGVITSRYTAEVWARGSYAYTTTWGTRAVGNVANNGNAIFIWNVAGNTPVLVDSVIVADAGTLGDVQVSDDGKLLVVCTERVVPGAIVVYDLTNPAKPQLLSRFANNNTKPGVHTCEIQRVNGKLYAFLSIDPSPVGLDIVDLSDPANPREVLFRGMGNPYQHDVFVRDGILFTALWNDGVAIWDIGGAGKGGSITNPVQLGRTVTVGGSVHNIWWFQDPVTGSKKYAFIGEEQAGAVGSSSRGDIHVVDVSDFANPREVAFFNVPNAGTHNFSMDEASGVLYAAYYNGGVRAIDVRGDLGTCTADQRAADGRCDLAKEGRQLASFTGDGSPVYMWGVIYTGQYVYASDMLNGLWKLAPVVR